MRIVLVGVLIVVALTGCGGRQGPIRRAYKIELQQLVPGQTTLQEFQALLPDSFASSQNVIGGQRFDAYELRHSRIFNSRWLEYEKLWFYFADTRLVKWGELELEDWPEAADVVMETPER